MPSLGAVTKPEVIGSTGVVTRPEEDTRVTITAAFHSGTETQTKAFVFTVKGTKHADLAYGGTASATTEQEGGEARNLTDGRADTGWLAAEEDEAPSVTLVLPETQKITKVLLRETGGLVQGFTLEISEDNKTWKTVHTGAAVGPEKEITFTVVKARYVRYTVTQKAAGATGLSAFEVRYEKSDYERVAADMESLKLEKSQDGTRYLLPKSGLNGSTITWKSSDPERIDPDTGLITRGGSAVRVVLTAMVTYGQAGDEKKWSVEVPGKGGTGGGGGGSSGGGGGVNLGGSTIVSPDQNQPENPVHPVKPDGMPFRDVPKESWSYDYIQRVQKAGIVSGDGSGNFYPQNNVTREEFVKMLALALELEPAEEGEYPFRDVADGDWFAPYVRVAYDSGIVKGVTGNDFGVGAHISRQDMAVMIDRALEKTGRKLEEGNWAVFADAAEIADYAKESVGRLNAAGILVGSNGAFYPTDTLTREQAAQGHCDDPGRSRTD